MGIFSSIKKTFKKIVKKIGRGIKKVAKGVGKVLGKIAKPFAKMGVLGQIALGFIMPWAVGGIFKGMGYLASEGFGAFAGNLASKTNLFQSAVGRLAQGIHMGASGINRAYSFISDGISAGLNRVSELGSKLKTGITDKFDAAAEWVTGKEKILTADEAFAKDVFAQDDFFSKGSYGVDTAADFAKEVVAPKNALTRTGEKLMKGGTKAFQRAGSAIMSEATKTTAEPTVIYADEGPSIAYQPDTPNKTIEDINFEVKSQGGYWSNPIDSMAIMEQYQYI